MNQFYYNNQKNAIIKACFLISILAVYLIAYVISSESIAASSLSKQSRSFELTYKVTIPVIPQNSKQVDIWIPVPQSDSFQQISDLKVTSIYPYIITTESEFGNQMLYIKADDNLPDSLFVEFRVQVARKQIATGVEYNQLFKKVNSEIKKQFLRPNRLVPIDGVIAEEAYSVVSDTMSDIEKAQAIYDHLTRTVSYDKTGVGWGNGDALYVCDARRGNCTDFHSLFIGMARALGIPARFAIGFPLIDNKVEGEISGYHCWAEFYIEGKGWIPVDVSEAHKHPEKHEFFFGGLDANRVQFTVGRDIQLQPPVTSTRMNYFIYPYVLLDNQPVSNISTKFYFSDN